MGNLRLLFVAGILVIGAILCQTRVGLGVVITIVLFGLFLTGMVHDRILNARDRARRALRFYEAGLERLNGTWAGKGSPGTEFLDSHHPYASDLDLFGTGSLFELLNTAQTQGGRAALAAWLLAPAAPDEIKARQEAVDELRTKLDLRERLGLIAAEGQGWIRTEALMSWAVQPRVLESSFARVVAFCIPLASAALYFSGNWELCLGALAAQFAVGRIYRRRVQKVAHGIAFAPGDLEWLAKVLRCLEKESFSSGRLRMMEEVSQCDGISASRAVERLARLDGWMISGDNLLFAAFCKFVLWETQFAFAIESWRARFGPKVELWLRHLAEFEALSSLACYAFEHPVDPLPELLRGGTPARVEAEGLAHPLIPESRSVRNDLSLGPECRLMMISGSNMSGKSTWLRAIGVNLVLASAGAPVRARRFRMTPVKIGASIRTADSLQEGISRSYAEIQRLGDVVKSAAEGMPLVFLLDEVLSGTNSHDRRIGAGCIALSLVQRGALGLMTTHDLALTRIVEEVKPPGMNFHFEDQLQEGRMSFDYRLRPGVVEKSNALELMRSVGLDVECGDGNAIAERDGTDETRARQPR
jgi:hypothetical protein